MLWHIFAYEVRSAVRRPGPWVFAAVYFAISFLVMNAAGGAFSAFQVATESKTIINSPVAIANWITILGLFGVVGIAAFVGGAGARDFEDRMDPLVLTAPISKRAYLGGRFLGGSAVAVLVLAAIPLGLAVGLAMPYLEHDQFGPFRAAAYWRPFLSLIVLNVLIVGSFFFAAAVLLRRGIANYIGGVLLIVGYLVAQQLMGDIQTQTLGGLLDPFGGTALGLTIRYWTVAERNTQLVPFAGMLATNRLLWLGIAAVVWAVMFVRFRVARDVQGRSDGHDVADNVLGASVALPLVRQQFRSRDHWAALRRLARHDLADIVGTRSFVLTMIAGLALLLVVAPQATKIYGTPTYPVTYSMLDILGGTWSRFLLVAIIVYAGELVWRDRDLRVDRITDTLPVPVWVRYSAKAVALAGLIALLLLLVLVGGVMTQFLHGYHRFELALYVEQLFGIRLVNAVLIAVLALTVHVIVNHKFLGHGIVAILVLGSQFFPMAGLEHGLLRYGFDGGWVYSDLNGFGHFLGPWAWWKLYWAAVAWLLALGAVVFWVRGPETAWAARRATARKRLRPATRRIMLAAIVVWAGLGAWILYNTTIVNRFETARGSERRAANYERTYRRFAREPQPRVVAVSVRADLFPKERAVTFIGRTTLKNTTATPIDSVHVLLSPTREVEVRRLALNRSARLVHEDREWQYRIFRLSEPLAPGDSTDLVFELAYRPRGFANQMDMGGMVANGSFVSNDLLPSIGYNEGFEVSNTKSRRRLGLPPKREGMPDLFDSTARRNSGLSRDADWIRLDITVSTTADQIAVAPGRLEREWREGDRRVFHYVQDAPVLNAFSFQSGRYAVFRDRWNDVDIEVLYHPTHDMNVRRIAEAAKKSLAYFSRSFGPYPHRVLRIVEFPRFGTYAQAFATTIPFSESIGFLASVDPETNIDYPFYVTAHEVAHQWWGHQVVGGNVQGLAMLVESMAQYSAFMLAEEEYGLPAMRRFLQYELDRYLTTRGGAGRAEPALYRVQQEGYLYYNKGSLVMYAMRDLLGKEVANDVFARYVAAKRFQAPPYTYTPELIDRLRAATPDSLHYAISDLFEKIVFYNNRATAAVARPIGSGHYQVELTVETGKVEADSLGHETSRPMHDLVDIGVYGRKAAGGELVPLYYAKHRLGEGTQQLSLVVDGEPVNAGIDPDRKLIDRAPGDNTIAVHRTGAAPPVSSDGMND